MNNTVQVSQLRNSSRTAVTYDYNERSNFLITNLSRIAVKRSQNFKHCVLIN
jgi:hypothetical protein